MFAGLALGLTVLGIASVVSFTVAQRVPEIGVRIALGANRRDVMTLIVRGALYPVCVGGAIGLIAAGAAVAGAEDVTCSRFRRPIRCRLPRPPRS